MTTTNEGTQREPKRACAVMIWEDGIYRTRCSYMIVGGRCIRHGAGGATYEVEPAK